MYHPSKKNSHLSYLLNGYYLCIIDNDVSSEHDHKMSHWKLVFFKSNLGCIQIFDFWMMSMLCVFFLGLSLSLFHSLSLLITFKSIWIFQLSIGMLYFAALLCVHSKHLRLLLIFWDECWNTPLNCSDWLWP